MSEPRWIDTQTMVLINRALVPRLRAAIDDYPSRVMAEADRVIRDVARGVVEAERWLDAEHGESPS